MTLARAAESSPDSTYPERVLDADERASVATSVSPTLRLAMLAVLLVPCALIVWMGWRHRWTSDDGFINLRIVRHIVDGHGPVFNTNQRIETGTSPLWLAVLSALDVLTPFRLEWIAAISALAATGSAVALAVFGTRFAIGPTPIPGVVLLPLGALVYAALPPAWDFATSALENGLGLLWIALCWWLLCARIGTREYDRVPRWWVPVIMSLGPLVRPDFAIFSVAFVACLLVLCERRRATVVRVLVLAAIVPVLTELARMAYYGRLVPTTAIAKEATSSNWGQGWDYVRDLFGPYGLAMPLLLFLGWWMVTSRGSGRFSQFRTIGTIAIAGGVLHGIYIVRVGGDFMHARMLLPTIFVVLLPVSVVAVRGAAWWLAAVIVGWALACALWLRPPYSAALKTGESAATAIDPYNARTGIADERLFWVRMSGHAHPITIDDYLPYNSTSAARRIARWADEGRSGLLLDHYSGVGSLIPLRPGIDRHIVVSAPSIGLVGYAAGDDVEVIDDHGLASVLAAHQRLEVRKRPGHEKSLSDAWVVAEYADPQAPVPATVDPRDVRAARRALACAPLRELLDDTTGPLTIESALHGLVRAPAATQYRIAPEPTAAAREACDSGSGDD